MDLPFLLLQSLNFRAYGLTPDLEMRYGADIRLIPESFLEKLILGHLSMYLHPPHI